MVRLSGHRGDENLGPVMDMTCRVQGRTVTASSRGVRGRHSTSDLPSTPTPLPASLHYDTSASGNSYCTSHIPYRSSAQEPLTEFSGLSRQLGTEFFKQMIGAVQPDSSYSIHGYTAGDSGISSSEPFMRSFMSVISKISMSCNKRPDKARDVPAPTQRKRVKTSDWEQTGPAEGGSIDSELIPSYDGHMAGPI
ncbi:hypothetical protein M9H77_28184 [Catharanthus roseus]|uniref:Uncharacterized protein n=1 Tax=Catharanthus roseus TaxID=4058 RepID=A0ACC0AFM0_CATRO|nr:hypothetical protein M9H77_28184 [Catharanthus roseus]